MIYLLTVILILIAILLIYIRIEFKTIRDDLWLLNNQLELLARRKNNRKFFYVDKDGNPIGPSKSPDIRGCNWFYVDDNGNPLIPIEIKKI